MPSHNRMYCYNCHQKTHCTRNCTGPIMSYGIICYKHPPPTNAVELPDSPENAADLPKDFLFAIVEVTNSYGFSEFVRGKYDINDTCYIQKLFDRMTLSEKRTIQETDFKTLFYSVVPKSTHKQIYFECSIKFHVVKNGFFHEKQGCFFNISLFVRRSTTKYEFAEWYFPKGRKQKNETDLQCAHREFKEETGITLPEYSKIPRYSPCALFAETHIAINKKTYMTQFYLVKYAENTESTSFAAISAEIKRVQWVPFSKIATYFRDYEREKIHLLEKIHKHISKVII